MEREERYLHEIGKHLVLPTDRPTDRPTTPMHTMLWPKMLYLALSPKYSAEFQIQFSSSGVSFSAGFSHYAHCLEEEI